MTVAEQEGKIGKEVLPLTILGAIAQLLGFGYRVGMSRMVGAEVMGLYQLVMSAYGVIQSMTMIGLTAALSNLTSRALAQRNLFGAIQTRKTCLRMFFLLMLMVGSVTILGSDFISVHFLGDARTQLGIVLLIPCATLTGIENLHKNMFYGAGKPLAPAVAEVVEQLVRAVAVLGLLILFLPQYPERAVGLIISGMILCEIVSASTLLGMYHHAYSKRTTTGEGIPMKLRWKQVGSIAIPVGVNALMGTFLGAANAALLPQKLLEGGMERADAISELGVLSGMTMPMLALPTVFLGAINLTIMPKLTASFALRNHRTVGELTYHSLSTVAKLAFPVMTMMVVLGQDLGLALFGREDVGRFLLPLGMATLISCFCSILTGVLNSVEKQSTVAVISIFGGIMQLVCTIFLTGYPGIGIKGYVFGIVFALGVEGLLSFLVVLRAVSLRPAWFDWGIAPGLSSALAGATSHLLIQYLKQQGVGMLYADGAGLLFAGIQYAITNYILYCWKLET